jgi:hypothetical protein
MSQLRGVLAAEEQQQRLILQERQQQVRQQQRQQRQAGSSTRRTRQQLTSRGEEQKNNKVDGLYEELSASSWEEDEAEDGSCFEDEVDAAAVDEVHSSHCSSGVEALQAALEELELVEEGLRAAAAQVL